MMSDESKRIWVVLLLGLSVVSLNCRADEDVQLEASRAIVRTFAADLQQALTSAMASGGPLAAIEVCRDEAPRIASAASRQHGAKVGRTSLKARNPQNLPETWQQQVLTDFAARHRAGESQPEFFERNQLGARYLSGIVTQEICTLCHGTAIDAALADQLAADYPYDRATGYRVGDLRGAFSVVWPQRATSVP